MAYLNKSGGLTTGVSRKSPRTKIDAARLAETPQGGLIAAGRNDKMLACLTFYTSVS